MWWNKIIVWFTEMGERSNCINEFNDLAKRAFINNTVPVYLKAETCKGNKAYKHQFSSFLFSGFRIRTLTGRDLTEEEVNSLGCIVINNTELSRRLVTLGFDTLEITDNHGYKLKDWQLTTLLQLR